MNMIKLLWCRFQRCLSTFTILLVEASSETGLYKHLSDYDFGVRNFENTKAMRVIFFLKRSKLQLDFRKAAQKREKDFCFWDNIIWIAIVRFPLLRTGYFSSTANVLTSSSKILHVNIRDFFQLNSLDILPLIW